jgi:predicted GNAT family N-acyltransferase
MNLHIPMARKDRPRSGASVHPLDHTEGHRLCGGLTIFTPTSAQIARLMDRAREDLPVALAGNDIVQRVAAANPDCFWAIARKRTISNDEPDPRGLVAMLMLNAAGVDALLCGALDTRNPPPEFLVGQHQRPSAIYGWLIHAKGTLAPGLTLVMEKLQAPLYRGVDIFCRASTADGAAFFDALGFSRGTWWKGVFRPEFRHYRRSYEGAGASDLADWLRAPFDDLVPGRAGSDPTVRASVVHTLDEILKVFAIRSAVYFEEEKCPYDEEFDGNDFTGTHLLAAIDGEPAGCVRIRYFGDFAKIERLAVLQRLRRRGLGRKLVTAAVELCRAKGYSRVYAHARKTLLPFWRSQGFAPLEGAAPFAFSDFEYVEVIRDLEPFPSALALKAGPYVLIRPEGQWDRPGVLEDSSQRGSVSDRGVSP